MLRRTARERREYVNKRLLQLQEAKLAERRRTLNKSLNENKFLDKDVATDKQLQKDFKYDASRLEQETGEDQEIDDEYYNIGTRDPKILITTSRDPSSRLQQFAKEMRLMIPNSHRLNRGNYVVDSIVNACRTNDVTDLVLLHEHRGRPDAIVISHFPYGPTASFSLHNVVLRHDLPDPGTISEAYPHLIFNNLSSKLGKRTQKILSALFPPAPKEKSPRVIAFANDQDFISCRHYLYAKSGQKQVELAEVGPRFDMRLFEIKLGTVENVYADIEWRLRNLQRHKKAVMSSS